MMNEEEYIYILKEKSCLIKTDETNAYKLTLSVFSNNTIDITICSTNQIPSKKFVLKCKMEELLKNRFFKLFLNVDEVFRELETKIENSVFIEESNVIFLDIPIGLNIINDVILEIKQIEKSKDDIIEELNKEITELKNKSNKLQNDLNLKIKEQESKINEITKNLNQKNDDSKIKLNLIS